SEIRETTIQYHVTQIPKPANCTGLKSLALNLYWAANGARNSMCQPAKPVNLFVIAERLRPDLRASVSRAPGRTDTLMNTRAYHLVDVFTDRAFGGNPLAVFLDGNRLSDALMQAIAKEFNLSETTFVFPPRDPSNDFG